MAGTSSKANSFIKTTLMAAVIGIGAFGINAATPAQAQAGNVQVGFSFNGPNFGFSVGPGHYYDGHAHSRPPSGGLRRSCRTGKALRKARRSGAHGLNIVRKNRRLLVIKGWKNGRRIKFRFANTRRCPLISVSHR